MGSGLVVLAGMPAVRNVARLTVKTMSIYKIKLCRQSRTNKKEVLLIVDYTPSGITNRS